MPPYIEEYSEETESMGSIIQPMVPTFPRQVLFTSYTHKLLTDKFISL